MLLKVLDIRDFSDFSQNMQVKICVSFRVIKFLLFYFNVFGENFRHFNDLSQNMQIKPFVSYYTYYKSCLFLLFIASLMEILEICFTKYANKSLHILLYYKVSVFLYFNVWLKF